MQPPQLLTRNHYRIQHVIRKPYLDLVECYFEIGTQMGGTFLRLPTLVFDDLVADLGMRPTSPAATEYESVPLAPTTAGRREEEH